MKITVNGKPQEIEGNEISLIELIKQNNVKEPDMVSVQLNEKFVKREDFDATLIKNEDEIDFLYFMGGGQRALATTLRYN